MKIKAILIITALLSNQITSHAGTFELTDSERADQIENLKKWDEISKSDPLRGDVNQNRDLIAKGIRKMTNVYAIPERFSVYEKLQEAALRIPGFSQYFADHLLKLYEDRLNAPGGTEIYAKATSDLQSSSSQDVITLIRMPCEETVYAVGPLLSYPKVDERPIDEFGNPGSSMTVIAFKILNRLPIKNRPYPEIDTRLEEEMIKAPEAIEKWKQWFEDLKAGKIEVEFGPEVFRDGSVPPFAMRHGVRLPKPRVIKKQDLVSQIKESQATWGIAGLAVLAASYAAWRLRRRNIGES